ncbi:MAG TPA: hypothetical protein DDW84_02210 [Phycisphaerales bacterium]|nr:MAG: hypothetical protein A2Y13_02710 [Planctomycetes bacterium GWC2_45_44]HBG77650.1 hypothetical protein [Phycisphaerales bacterium]HBR20859.1 hypothetical protein [Phycisphaerales bacterium]
MATVKVEKAQIIKVKTVAMTVFLQPFKTRYIKPFNFLKKYPILTSRNNHFPAISSVYLKKNLPNLAFLVIFTI